MIITKHPAVLKCHHGWVNSYNTPWQFSYNWNELQQIICQKGQTK
jgi:hypothetical protein